MLSEKEQDKQTMRLGLYGLIAIFFFVAGIYFAAPYLTNNEKNSELNCLAVQNIFNTLEEDVETYKKRGYSSTTARKHNRKLNTAIATAKKSGCFTQNLRRIRHYLQLDE